MGASGGYGESLHSSGGNPDEDLARMKELQEEELRLKKASKVDAMRRRLEQQKKKVKHPRGRAAISAGLRNFNTEREKISDEVKVRITWK